ncbi:MAG: hypothetical protein GF417_07370, partial [Candidatus Latescibacteria bacterium]|nr:hypothetical protein [bacterium]MBD3424239.1 hypothetical protein [Candidatus Latescibacterota bacterium]
MADHGGIKVDLSLSWFRGSGGQKLNGYLIVWWYKTPNDWRYVMRNKVVFLLMLVTVSLALLLLGSGGGLREEPASGDKSGFSFAFLADIHVQPELGAMRGFEKAVNLVNRMDPDFVITGGDLIMDALEVSYGRADTLYRIYRDISGRLRMPVHNTMGNHEILGWYDGSPVSPSHPHFGKKIYEERLGRRFYSFDHGGWHFIIIDSIERGEEGGYIGKVNGDQMEWIREDLSGVDRGTPIAVSTHIPVVSVMPQLREGPGAGISPSEVIVNSREVLELFSGHNLKLVLQGHLHLVEEIRVRGTTFITAGAVSG